MNKLIISNGSKKRCRSKFDYVGINKIINRCSELLSDFPVEDIIAEEIYDHWDALTYNVFLFLLLENCKDDKILKELSKFNVTVSTFAVTTSFSADAFILEGRSKVNPTVKFLFSLS